ncbi:hypothetical protein [Bifidobacterium saguinibicoloris]|uniref:hypothetical protein n=1 Tax=Bifidobacterium saguinibicoloris TaxID=2834433 RepID=UPI001C58CF33|nr:hypothetical protein [Bifidobacterium saguinibicoloris]MBW3080569.1 hypothetical protein [Bifidobacterium saguinibicoloris]
MTDANNPQQPSPAAPPAGAPAPMPAPQPYPVQPAPAPKPKKPVYRRWWFWAVVVVVVLGIAGAVGGGSNASNGATGSGASSSQSASTDGKSGRTQDKSDGSASDDGGSQETKPAEKTIELQATATGNGTVMWFKGSSSSTEQFNGSWSKTFTGDDAKDITGVSVTGDIMGGNDQKMSCKVIVNGEEKESQEGSGSAGSAYCSVPWF